MSEPGAREGAYQWLRRSNELHAAGERTFFGGYCCQAHATDLRAFCDGSEVTWAEAVRAHGLLAIAGYIQGEARISDALAEFRARLPEEARS